MEVFALIAQSFERGNRCQRLSARSRTWWARANTLLKWNGSGINANYPDIPYIVDSTDLFHLSHRKTLLDPLEILSSDSSVLTFTSLIASGSNPNGTNRYYGRLINYQLIFALSQSLAERRMAKLYLSAGLIRS